MVTPEQVIAVAGLLLLVSVVASKTAGRLGVPALVFFVLVGMLAGSEGPGGIAFEDATATQFLGVVALVLILFAGGLDTRWAEVRRELPAALLLSTIGVAATAGVMGLFLYFAMGYPLLLSLLFGCIVSSTDAAAVFATLRSRNVSLKGRLRPLLELESGSNDPMAVLLTVGVTAVILGTGGGWAGFGVSLVLQLVIGGVFGYAGGRAMAWMINRVNLHYDGLYPVLTLALILTLYGATAWALGNGFLAAYLGGIVLGNSRFVHRASLIRYHDGLAWLMQISMFLVLGLLVFPSQLWPVAGLGIAASAWLMLVARPVAVFLCLTPLRVPWREQVLVSWVGLRGAVPIILATFPLLAGVEGAAFLFNVVFFVVLASVMVQGPSIPLVAKLLKLDAPLVRGRHYPIVFDPTPGTKNDLVEIALPLGAAAEGKRIVDLKLPEGTLIVLVSRGEEFLVPRGTLSLLPGDRLLVLADQGQMAAVRAQLESAAATTRTSSAPPDPI